MQMKLENRRMMRRMRRKLRKRMRMQKITMFLSFMHILSFTVHEQSE
mgnify:CR=1 FL=1